MHVITKKLIFSLSFFFISIYTMNYESSLASSSQTDAERGAEQAVNRGKKRKQEQDCDKENKRRPSLSILEPREIPESITLITSDNRKVALPKALLKESYLKTLHNAVKFTKGKEVHVGNQEAMFNLSSNDLEKLIILLENAQRLEKQPRNKQSKRLLDALTLQTIVDPSAFESLEQIDAYFKPLAIKTFFWGPDSLIFHALVKQWMHMRNEKYQSLPLNQRPSPIPEPLADVPYGFASIIRTAADGYAFEELQEVNSFRADTEQNASGEITTMAINNPKMKLSDISFLSKPEYEHIKKLIIRSQPVTDIAPLINLPQLEEFELTQVASLSHSNIDLAPLADKDLASFKKLTIKNAPYNLKQLNDLHRLQSLTINKKINESVAGLHNLQYLNVNNLGNNANIAELKQLEELSVNHGLDEGFDVGQLGQLTALTKIKIGNATEYATPSIHLKNIAFIANLPELEIIDFSNHEIDSLEPLTGLEKLKEIYLAGNKISSITPLENLFQLKYINLSRNNISNIDPLRRLLENRRMHNDRRQERIRILLIGNPIEVEEIYNLKRDFPEADLFF